MDESASTTEPPPDRITTIWRRLKEHSIAQWTVGYVAVAYGIQHAVTLTDEAFKWPDAVLRVSMLLLALGLPVAMALAWYHGERASRRMSTGEFSILSMLLICASILFYAFVRPSTEFVTTAPAAVQQASVTAARSAGVSLKGAISVAVLPFLNLSPDKDQEFFSDGMTEEITAALAKVPDLRVVARTSAFEFKGKNIEIEKIGQQLHATHLIEGSVRKAGNRLRITAQLIKADDGTHIWAEDYDRELTDVFAIQEDIARAITSSLHMTLGLKPGENLVNNRKIDARSYEKYLRARALIEGRGGGEAAGADDVRRATEAVLLLENALAENPAYAPAWTVLANAYGLQALGSARLADIVEARALVKELRGKAEASLQKSLQLDPSQAEAYALMAWFVRSRGNPLSAEEYLEKSLALDPVNSNVLFVNGMLAASSGRLTEALDFYEKGHAVARSIPISLASPRDCAG